MKTLATLTVLFLTLSLTAQQSYICFPREKQAKKQVARLNYSLYGMVWNKTTQEYDLTLKNVIRRDSLFCVAVNCEDSEKKYWRGNKLAIKKRHYKYIITDDKAFFDTSEQCWLEHNPSKFQNMLKKVKQKIKKSD